MLKEVTNFTKDKWFRNTYWIPSSYWSVLSNTVGPNWPQSGNIVTYGGHGFCTYLPP